MRFPTMVLRNLRRRRLASILTGFSVSLGVGLFATVGAMREASEVGFQRSASLCDMLVGAKGSSSDLTLNALYHMGQSPGNVPFDAYREITATPGVLWSVPLAVGDSFRGHRIVGITSNFFDDVKLLTRGEEQDLEFAQGEGFSFSAEQFVALKAELKEEESHGHVGHGAHGHGNDHPELFRAVLGADVAKRTGMKVGDHFAPTHGVKGATDSHEEGESEVVGVLARTGTPMDRAIFLPIGAYYILDGHEPTEDMVEGGARDPRGLSGIMMRTKAGFYRTRIYRGINDRLDAMAVYPSLVIRELFERFSMEEKILRWITALIVVVALVGVMVAIYNTMDSRRREFAILRALGARRRTILSLVTAESALLALLGGLTGLGLAGLLIYAVAGQMEEATGVSLTTQIGWSELQLLLAVTLAGGLAGLVPALSAYRTEAARTLSSHA